MPTTLRAHALELDELAPHPITRINTTPVRSRSTELTAHKLDGLSIVAIAVVVVTLCYDGMNLWWINTDETHILSMAVDFPALSYFTVPEIYRLLTPANLTPWVLASFDMDLELWGFDPVAFRVHQMISSAFLNIVTYAFLRLWTPWWLALLGTLAFTVMSATVSGFFLLPLRHYVEGFIFAILSAYCFFHAARKDSEYRTALLILSTAFYTVSVTAKEVYVPLLVFLFLIDTRSFLIRFRNLAGHILVASIYCAWRWHMLGAPVGGYKETSTADLLGSIPLLIQSLPRGLYDSRYAALSFLVGVLTALVYTIATRQFRLVYLWAFLLCAIVPVIPVAYLIPVFGVENLTRYFFVIGWLLALFVAISVTKVGHPLVKGVVVAALSSTLVFGYAGAAQNTQDFLSNIRDTKTRCARFVWENLDNTDVIVLRAGSFTYRYFMYIVRLKGSVLRAPKPFIFQDDLLLPDNVAELEIWIRDQSAEGCFVPHPQFSAQVLRRLQGTTTDGAWSPTVLWRDEGFDWLSNREVDGKLLLLVGGNGRGERIRLKGNQGSVTQLRRILYRAAISPPAAIRFKAVDRLGNAVVSEEIPIPDTFWDFQQGGPLLSSDPLH